MLSVYQVSFYQRLGYVYRPKNRVFKGFFGHFVNLNTYNSARILGDIFQNILSRKSILLEGCTLAQNSNTVKLAGEIILNCSE